MLDNHAGSCRDVDFSYYHFIKVIPAFIKAIPEKKVEFAYKYLEKTMKKTFLNSFILQGFISIFHHFVSL